MRHVIWMVLSLGVMVFFDTNVTAQPSRQLPGVAGFTKMTPQPPGGQPPRNSRIRPAANQVGFQSTDFYPKRGYPRFLGDAVEAGDAAGGATGATGAIGQTGATGQTGGTVFGGGFQGNIGNQIGQQQGGTIFGGIFGGNQGGNNQGGGIQGGGIQGGLRAGMSGGGFTGLVPKGFGFGGIPPG